MENHRPGFGHVLTIQIPYWRHPPQQVNADRVLAGAIGQQTTGRTAATWRWPPDGRRVQTASSGAAIRCSLPEPATP